MKKVTVSPDSHFLMDESGEPFFWLADTAWLLFNKLKEEEIRLLFEDRKIKGFTAVQSVIFRDLFTPNSPNAYGVTPFASEEDMYAVRMNPEWIDYVHRIVRLAEEMGLVMGLLPTWGDKWNEDSNSAGPVIMDKESAHNYGRFLSDALADCPNIIWILGGDSPTQTQAHADIVHAMACGIRLGGSSECLTTFHPCGNQTSEQFHASDWLDFNAMQSGHSHPNLADYKQIEIMYRTSPAKPCMNMEPNYEHCIPFKARAQQGNTPIPPRLSAYDVRKCLYRSILAGGAGFTYGCEPIRQVHREGDRIHAHPHEGMPTWDEAMKAPGSGQLQYLVQRLMERSYFTRTPAQELLISGRTESNVCYVQQRNDDPVSHIRVAACSEGSYIMAYCPVRQLLILDTERLSSDTLKVSLVNPETGESECTYTVENSGSLTIVPLRDLDTFIIVDTVKK